MHNVLRSAPVLIISQSGATCIIHTASPPHDAKNPDLFYKVNVEGTKTIIAAAQATGVKKLVFTSSAGTVFNGNNLTNIDERYPAPEKAMDAYNETKLKAEQAVLAANGQGGLLTVALRPSGIFGCAMMYMAKGGTSWKTTGLCA